MKFQKILNKADLAMFSFFIQIIIEKDNPEIRLRCGATQSQEQKAV